MSRILAKSLLASLLLGSLVACAPAYADRPARPGPLVATPAGVQAPYDIEILDADGVPLRTYARGGRYYVLGQRGERYVVRVSNPTPRRIEAVVTVDGLDVIDGEGGDARKRGYVIQPYGELRVEGFCTSTADVATFRFSSVAGSYAGRKGKARNVGVIAVALFEEEAPPPPVYIPEPYPHPRPYPRSYDEGGAPRGESRSESRKVAPTSGAAPAAPPSSVSGSGAGRASATADAESASDNSASAECCAAPRPQRPGLGTEYGEQRYSAVSFTRFVRSTRRPVAVAELRYNDASGLAALGIPVAPMPDEDELYTRESADPFPGDRQFSRPPGGVY
jgi:hypothetical protein